MSALRSDLQIAPSEIYSSSSTQGTDLGARATTGDGRVYRYCLAGSTTALVAGKLYQSPAQHTANYQNLTVAAAGTLTTTVTTTTTVTLVTNELAGAIMTVRSGTTGAGFSYKIKNHAAATAGTVAFTLEDPIQVAIAASAVVEIAPNPYNGVIIAATTLTGTPVGVPAANVAAGQYGWVQTRGLCAGYSEGAITVGNSVAASTGTAGALAATQGTNSIVVGYAAITTADQKYDPFFLCLE